MHMKRKKYKSPKGEEYHISFWKAGDHYRLQTDDPAVVRRVKTWKFAKETGWGWNCYLYIFVIPIKKAKWVAKQFDFDKQPRSTKQKEVTNELVERGHGHRFDVNLSGQEFYSEARRRTISSSVRDRY